jgi:hypothetical protein
MALCRELALEKSVDLLYDRLWNDDDDNPHPHHQKTVEHAVRCRVNKCIFYFSLGFIFNIFFRGIYLGS